MLCPLSPECEIECPERLTTALERLQQHGLKQRCLQLVAREASEAELGLVHRSGGEWAVALGGGACPDLRCRHTEPPTKPQFPYRVGRLASNEVGTPSLLYLLLLATLPCLPASLQP